MLMSSLRRIMCIFTPFGTFSEIYSQSLWIFERIRRGVVHYQKGCTDFVSSKKSLEFLDLFRIFRIFRIFWIFFGFFWGVYEDFLSEKFLGIRRSVRPQKWTSTPDVGGIGLQGSWDDLVIICPWGLNMRRWRDNEAVKAASSLMKRLFWWTNKSQRSE